MLSPRVPAIYLTNPRHVAPMSLTNCRVVADLFQLNTTERGKGFCSLPLAPGKARGASCRSALSGIMTASSEPGRTKVRYPSPPYTGVCSGVVCLLAPGYYRDKLGELISFDWTYFWFKGFPVPIEPRVAGKLVSFTSRICSTPGDYLIPLLSLTYVRDTAQDPRNVNQE